MIHQSVFGPEHLGAGISKEAIRQEMHDSQTNIDEPLLVPISVDAGICRINLRTANKLKADHATIAEAVRKSARRFSRDPEELCRLWGEIRNFMDELPRGFGREDYEKLTQSLREKGYLELHHSLSYREANRPAYRVLFRNELELLTPDLPASGLSH